MLRAPADAHMVGGHNKDHPCAVSVPGLDPPEMRGAGQQLQVHAFWFAWCTPDEWLTSDRARRRARRLLVVKL